VRYADRRLEPEAALRDLSHPQARVRLQAADSLGHLPADADPGLAARVRTGLRAALRDDDAEIRYAAALSLGELRDAEAATALVEQMEGDGHPLPRQAATIALGLIGQREAVPALLRALQSAPRDVRFQAATSLVQLDPESAVAPLRRALRDQDAEVRSAAASALGDLGDRESAPALARLLDDSHPGVRFDAAGSLARLGDRRGTQVLLDELGNDERRLAASEHLFRCPDPAAAPVLRHLLGRWLTPAQQKVWLAATLARLVEADGREHLLRLLGSRRQAVRGLCIQVLGEIGEPWALEALRHLAQSPAGADWSEELAEALAGREP